MGISLAYLFGIKGYDEKLKERLDRSNLRAGLFVTGFVACVEIWMILRTLGIAFYGSIPKTMEWVINHLRVYVILLFSSLFTFVYSYRGVNGKGGGHTVNMIVQTVYSFIGMAFGLYVSHHDYSIKEQLLCFVTMLVFATCVYVWRPIYSLLINTVCTLALVYVCNSIDPISSATKINLFTAWMAINIASVRAYHGIRGDR